MLMLGTIFVWMVGCIPFHALLTISRPGIPWLLRFVIGMFLSGVAVVLLWWASMEYRTGWMLGVYAVVMLVANFVSIVGLIARWFMRRR